MTKTYFLFDFETGFILSGFDCCEDSQDDGYNLFTRPYKYPEYHFEKDHCRMDTLYREALRSGLNGLKRENLRVGVVDHYGFGLKQEFVKNPDLMSKNRGWWRLLEKVETL